MKKCRWLATTSRSRRSASAPAGVDSIRLRRSSSSRPRQPGPPRSGASLHATRRSEGVSATGELRGPAAELVERVLEAELLLARDAPEGDAAQVARFRPLARLDPLDLARQPGVADAPPKADLEHDAGARRGKALVANDASSLRAEVGQVGGGAGGGEKQ